MRYLLAILRLAFPEFVERYEHQQARKRSRPIWHALFANADGEAARRFFDVPSDPAERIDTLAQFIWAQACSGKFVWPIADRGFSKHAHRIASPTLIVWGAADGIIAPLYAQEFARRIADARVELIEQAGHLPHLECPETVTKLVRAFLGG